jgi:Family of unknown function (DUF6467)
VGGYDSALVGVEEPLVRYHSIKARILTDSRYPASGQYQVGSLTGAVASKMITEARKGSLRLDGNQP